MHDSKTVRPSLAQQLKRTLPRRPHVLLVLKDEVYATVISVWLSRLGWDVTQVAEVTQALEAWRESGAAVALVDLDDDGLGALAVLAAATAFRPLGRAVICTRDRALVELPEDLRRRLGIEEIAVRPCHVSVLGAAIQRAAGASGSFDWLPASPLGGEGAGDVDVEADFDTEYTEVVIDQESDGDSEAGADILGGAEG